MEERCNWYMCVARSSDVCRHACMHSGRQQWASVLPAPVVAVVGLAALVAPAPLEEVVYEALHPARRLADLAVDAAHQLPRAAATTTASSSAASRASSGAIAVAFRFDRRRGLHGRLRGRGRRRRQEQQHADRSGLDHGGGRRRPACMAAHGYSTRHVRACRRCVFMARGWFDELWREDGEGIDLYLYVARCNDRCMP